MVLVRRSCFVLTLGLASYPRGLGLVSARAIRYSPCTPVVFRSHAGTGVLPLRPGAGVRTRYWVWHLHAGRVLFSRWDWPPTLASWGWCLPTLLPSRRISYCPRGPLLRSHTGAAVLARSVAMCWRPLPALASSAGAALSSLLSFSCACAHSRASLSRWGRCPCALSTSYYAARSISCWHLHVHFPRSTSIAGVRSWQVVRRSCFAYTLGLASCPHGPLVHWYRSQSCFALAPAGACAHAQGRRPLLLWSHRAGAHYFLCWLGLLAGGALSSLLSFDRSPWRWFSPLSFFLVC